MSWLRVDDTFPTHPKVSRLDDDFGERVSMNARAVWLTAGCVCGQHKRPTIDVTVVRRMLPCSRKDFDLALSALVSVGLIDRLEDGSLELHDWNHYQKADPTNAERQRRKRERTKEIDDRNALRNALRNVDSVTIASVTAVTPPVPTRPDPSRPNPSEGEDPSLRSGSPRAFFDTDEKRKPKKADLRVATAERLFAYWKKEYERPRIVSSKSDIKHAVDRITELERAYDPEDPSTDPEHVIQMAIVGMQFSPHHNGSDGGPAYMEFFHACKNQKNINMFYPLGAAEMERREKAQRAKASETQKPEPRLQPPHVPQERLEEVPRYVRSFECLESFYGAQAKAGAERLEALRAHVAAYPGDTEAQMVLVLAGVA